MASREAALWRQSWIDALPAKSTEAVRAGCLVVGVPHCMFPECSAPDRMCMPAKIVVAALIAIGETP